MNKWRSKYLSVIIASLMIINLAMPAALYAMDWDSADIVDSVNGFPTATVEGEGNNIAKPETAPLNPDYLRYMHDRIMKVFPFIAAEKKEKRGVIPSPNNIYLSFTDPMPSYYEIAQDLPASYDLREEERVTPVKDQGDEGVCWAFAAIGALESYLMDEEERNFSENHMRHSLSNDNGNELGFDRSYDCGGNRDMATAYYARWSGPVDEEDDPFVEREGSRDPEENENKEVQKHIQQVLWIPDPYSPEDQDNLDPGEIDTLREKHRNLIKKHIMKYGAVNASMRTGDEQFDFFDYYNENNNAFYYHGDEYSTNHSILIVGWDDDFNKNKFNQRPENHGAFIIKNSWGDDIHEDGYFYISYEDKVIGHEATVYVQAESTDNYDIQYSYSPFGITSQMGTGAENWFANVYEVEGEDDEYEFLSAVSLFSSGWDYEYEIWVNNECGELAEEKLEKVKTVSLEMPGYHTIKLDTPILLSGDEFVIAANVDSGEDSFPIPLERKIDGYASNVTGNSGEGFISHNGKVWDDVTGINQPDSISDSIAFNAFTVTEESYPVTFVEENEVDGALIQVYSDAELSAEIGEIIVTEEGEATKYLIDGDYWFKAQLAGYKDYEGNFNVDGGAENVEFMLEEQDYEDNDFEGGFGTEEDPFKIATAEQLNIVRDDLFAHYVLVEDIDLDVEFYNTHEGWIPLGDFRGTLNGQGHTISGIYINSQEQDVGLFSRIGHSAEVRNLNLADVNYFSSRQYVGALAGKTSSQSLIENVTVSGEVTSDSYFAGGLIGQHDGGIISDSYSSVTVTASGGQYIGGLVGYSYSDIENSQASGNVTARWNVGGLVGYIYNGDIIDCAAYGDVIGESRLGGLVGIIIGTHYGSISNSYATGNVTGERSVGGLIGDNRVDIISSYATGNVKGETNTGGLVGQQNGNDALVENSYAEGDVTGLDNTGGLVGYSRLGDGIINSRATGFVSGDNYVGGLVGLNTNHIRNSFATGYVMGKTYVGGLVGANETSPYVTVNVDYIADCYAIGPVNGTDKVGGLVGFNEYYGVNRSYAVGPVFGLTDVGGLLGLNEDGDVTSSFYDTEITGRSDQDKGISQTTEEMNQETTYTEEGWNFDEVWTIDEDAYPYFSWQDEYIAPPALPKMGNVTGDGTVTVNDAILILRHIVGIADINKEYGAKAFFRANVNGNGGTLNVADAISVLRYIVGLNEKFPVEE